MNQWIATGYALAMTISKSTYARAPLGSFGPAPPRAKTLLAPPSSFAMSVILPSMAPLLLLLETNTEAKVAVAVARGVAVALGGTQDRSGVVPGTTAEDPV